MGRERFRPEYFSIKEWRGDKYVDGVYAESSENPDLEIEFRLRGISTTLAVECKWRQSFERRDKVGLTWASSRQIANYQRFADDLRDREGAKVQCGEAHFEALAVGENPARFLKATKLEDVLMA